MLGKVKLYNAERGYGFIEGENGTDIFVHYSAIIGTGFRSLIQGELVEFELYEGEKGLQAINVKKIKR